MIVAPDKGAVARNFSAAACAYDGAAAAQAEIADGLLRCLPPAFAPRRIVDLGCGTGRLAARLLRRWPGAKLLGVDLADGMIDACRRRFTGDPRARFIVADAEDPVACAGPVDLVTTSCAVQWFADPEGTLRRWGRVLAPGGVIAAALLVHGSYPEMAAAHRAAFGTPFHGLAFPSEDDAVALFGRAGLSLDCAEPSAVAVAYPSARDALASFRGIGAVLRGQPGRRPLGAGGTRRLIAAYEALCGPQGALVTHRVLSVVARAAP